MLRAELDNETVNGRGRRAAARLRRSGATAGWLVRVLVVLVLVCGTGPLAQAQDGDDAGGDRVIVMEPERGGVKPGVVERDRPADISSDVEGVAAPGAGNTGAGASGGSSDVIQFGETIDIEGNFGGSPDIIGTPSNMKITIDFRDADLNDVVKFISATTGRNFIISDSLRAGKKITIISPNPVTPAQAFQAFLSALEMNGLTIVRSGAFYKVLDVNSAPNQPIDMISPGGSVPANDAIQTRIVELQHVDLATVMPVIQQLKTPTGRIIEYPPNNMFIITDTGNAIRRVLDIVVRLDNPGADSEKIWIYQVQYADASELANLVTQVFAAGQQNRQQQQQQTRRGNPQQQQQQQQVQATPVDSETDVQLSNIVADERTNKLIIVANERSYQRIKQLILKLDIELPDSGRINVVHLQNSDASELAQTLSSLSSELKPQDPRRAPVGQPGQPGQPAAAANATLTGEVSVVANEPTNDVIIVASPRDFLALRSVIRELDRPRKQVFIEAVILEVSVDRMRSLGIVAHGGNVIETDSGDAYLVGRTELNSLQSLQAGPLFLGSGSAPGLLAAIIGPSIDLGPLEVPSVGVLLQALQTNTDVNVLSTPTLLTLDNEEAEISVGERIPFLTSAGGIGGINPALLSGSGLSSTDLGAAAGLLGGTLGLGGTQITRVDVALTLRVKPQINEAGSVRLEIEEEIEEVKPGGQDLGGPTTRRRNLRTVVIVEDQQTVVLGGLIRDAENQSVSKVPLLGDIPVIGYLFRSTDTQIQKQNLLLLLTPYIIESQADLDKIHKRKMEEREAFLAFFGRRDLNYVKTVNFDKKHGLLEQMRQTIDSTEAELSAIRDAQGILELRRGDEGIELPEGLDDGGYDGLGTGGDPVPEQPRPQ